GSFVRASAQQKEPQAQPPQGPAVIKLKGLDGKTYDSSAMRGDVLVVSFGATWCTPCTWELVAIEELKEEYAGKPVRFLWVSIEAEKQTSDNLLRHYAKQRKLTIPVLRDPEAQAFAQFSTSTRIPVVVFFDQEGRHVAPVHRGMSAEISEYKKLVRARVDALLKTKEAGAAATGAGAAVK
ncbi:MAG TPA: TlpA disulfide reductase family protein, partial [Pyrinomonadaceae bacterium]|nr:TlpA disulfide reductase family protein [Pyrinomonadaceae bacterium]